jgi:ParB family transcriptional regulator, chromosome partitioning protein
MSQPKKPSLGKGLEALLGQMASARAPLAAPTPAPGPSAAGPAAAAPILPGDRLASLAVEVLQRGRYQPRVDLRPESLEDLASSIRAQGVVQPIIVRPLVGSDGDGVMRYEIIAGERRWRAAQMAGLAEVPAVVRAVPDEAAIAMALIENIQRENLNPLEEARALDRLIREFGVTHQQAADAVGRSRAAVSNLLRLLDLAPAVSALVEARELEMGHARALLALSSQRQQGEVGALVARKGLSVRETEALVRRLVSPPGSRSGADGADVASALSGGADPNVTRLQNELSEKLGARVSIQHAASSGKGKLVVAYNSLDELDGILSHIQ